MKNKYILTPNNSTILSDSFSYEFSQLGKFILSEQYPDKIPTVIGPNNPDPLDLWSVVLPSVSVATNPIVILTDPLNRFKQFVVKSKLSIEEALAEKYLKIEYDKNSAFYKIEDHQSEIAELLNFSEIDIIFDNADVALTDEQLSKFENVFSKELEIYNKITSAGQTLDELYPAPVYVPNVITVRQFWLAALEYGFDRDDVIALVESLPETSDAEILFKKASKIDLYTATTYDRNNQTLNAIGQILGVNSDQIDQIFIKGIEL